MISFYMPLSHSTANLRFAVGKMASIQSHSICVLDSGKGVFVTSPFHCLDELDQQMQPR